MHLFIVVMCVRSAEVLGEAEYRSDAVVMNQYPLIKYTLLIDILGHITGLWGLRRADWSLWIIATVTREQEDTSNRPSQYIDCVQRFN